MSDPPENFSPQNELNYQSTSPHGNAPTNVKLAAIFTLISAGFSGIGVLYMIALAIFAPFILKTAASPGAPGMSPSTPFSGPTLSIVYSVMAVGALVVAIVKIVGGTELLRGTHHHVWGWGLAASILGCLEIGWCSFGCVLPLAAGIFGIVILCQANTQSYLRARAASAPHPPIKFAQRLTRDP